MPDVIEKQGFEGFAVLELMGHRKLAGYVRQVEMFGSAMCRIDVPAIDGQAAATQFYSGGSIYCLTPCDEATALRIAGAYRPEPVNRWSLPAPQPTRAARDDQPYIDFGDDDSENDPDE